VRRKGGSDFVREYFNECLKVVDDLCGGIYQFELLLFVIFGFDVANLSPQTPFVLP
jgi:hypothetical protein